MKKIIIYITLLFLILANTECKKDVTQTLYGAQNSNTFYKTETQVNEALTGAYLQLATQGHEFGVTHMQIGDGSTDDVVGEDNLGQFVPVDPTDSRVGQLWAALYLCIARANEVITYSAGATGNQANITQYINEAKLLRGFCYYYLTYMYGGVPLFTTPETPNQSLTTARSSVNDVLKQVIADCTDATALPSRIVNGAPNKFRVTRGLAYSLLGKVYMFEKDYPNAEIALQTVVNSGDYTLLTDYGAIWRTDGTTESVFDINYLQLSDITAKIGSTIPQAFSVNISGNASYAGGNGHQPTLDLYNEFDPNDPRITYTFTQTGDRFINDIADQNNSANYRGGLFGRKTFVPYYLRSQYNFYTVPYTVRVIRYADIILLYAEALNENGKTSAAIGFVNQIRTRARQTPPMDPQRIKQFYLPVVGASTLVNLSPGLSQSDARLAIWHERRCELGLEGWRREDLVRQQRYGQVMLAFATRPGAWSGIKQGIGFKDARDYVLPIPKNDVTYTNGKIAQNPGY
jgi:hypothetical protein